MFQKRLNGFAISLNFSKVFAVIQKRNKDTKKNPLNLAWTQLIENSTLLGDAGFSLGIFSFCCF
jgi:hypothetical protein